LFPLSADGKVVPQDGTRIDTGALLDELRDRLQAEGATELVLDGSTLRFKVPFWKPFWSWQLLVPLDEGILRVNSDAELEYEFSLRRTLLIATVGTVWVASMVFLRGGGALAGLWIFAICWLWVFGMNYVTALVRLSHFVRGCVYRTAIPA